MAHRDMGWSGMVTWLGLAIVSVSVTSVSVSVSVAAKYGGGD